MQNSAAMVAVMSSRCHNIKPILKDLHWLPVKGRILSKVLLLVYKSKNNYAPEYLTTLCISYWKDFNSRSNHLDLLDLGPKSRMKTYGDGNFKIARAEEWNKLPLSLKRSSSVELFKTEFKILIVQISIFRLKLIYYN